jgi:hypothetical protein
VSYRDFADYVDEDPQGAARLRTEWLSAPGLEIYCRRSIRYPGVIVLANIVARPMKQGHFTRFLEEWSPRLPLEVEHPHNPYLKAFLVRLGWRVQEIWGDVHVYNERACELIDARG